jgi:RNA polymerase sigma-70 factor (ECF subfamily)
MASPGPRQSTDSAAAALTVEAVFRLHGPRVVRCLRYLGVPAGELDDAVQDVFLVVHRKLSGFRGDAEVETWLYGICVRVEAGLRRKRRRPESPPDARVSALPSEALERKQAREALLRALQTLDEHQRAVFVLHEIEQQPMSAIAALLECPLFTAYSRLRLARQRLLPLLTEVAP